MTTAPEFIRKAIIDEATKEAMLFEHADNLSGGVTLDTLLSGINSDNTAAGARTALELGTAATTAATAYATAAQGAKADTAVQPAGLAMAQATAANIADKTHAINTTGKTKGKFVYDTTNDLVMFALGTTDVSKWRLSGSIDNTGDVTPS